MKVKPWTSDERNILKKYYGSLKMPALMEKLPGRSEKSIYNQVYYLRKRGWKFK
jgi:hypothetical protein